MDGISAVVLVGLSTSTTNPTPTISLTPSTAPVDNETPTDMIVVIYLAVVGALIIAAMVGGVIIRYGPLYTNMLCFIRHTPISPEELKLFTFLVL